MAWARSSPAWVLSTNPRTPARTASVTRRSCSSAVSITTWVSGHASTIWRAASMPFRSGIMISSTATSGSCCRVKSTAARPSDASATTSRPWRSSRARTPCRSTTWSSASTTRSAIVPPGSSYTERAGAASSARVTPGAKSPSTRELSVTVLVMSSALPAPPRLSKSRYLSGLQCHKQLWWRVHDPDASELSPSAGQQNLLAQGREVGVRARQHVPGGQLIDLPFYQHDNMVAATRDALQHDVPAIYEAWFLADETYVGVDILERTARGYGVIEVKASNSRKPEHLPDAAVQVHVLRRAGLPVERAEVMHLNPQCRYPDLANLFIREDVTALVEGALIGVPDELAAQQAMLAGPLPDVPIGEHCTTPHDCPFIARCWPKTSDHHVSSLYRIDRKRARELEADGFATIYDLPSDLELSVIHARQVRAVQSGRMVVEPTLARALAQFAPPLAFLDFETVSLAVPRWTGCRPWQQVPVQFSVHAEERGALVHHEWIGDGPEDPRAALAAALVEACAGAKKIVAYYASFERDCIRQLREAVPGCAKELERIERRLVDLLPVIRRHVYHPEFGGGFSLKKTLPALVPGLSYADLQVQDGEVATVELQRLMLRGAELPADERAALRDALLRYCERDTWAVVKLLEKLRSLVADELELLCAFWKSSGVATASSVAGPRCPFRG